MVNSARQPPTPWYQPQVVIDVADKTLNGINNIENVLKGVQFFSGSEAFRQYNWLRQTPTFNTSGDLRGMVINSDARVVFNYSTNLIEKVDKFGNVLLIAGVVINLFNERGKIEAIAASNQPGTAKAAQYCLIGSMAIIQALTGVVPLATHVLATSIEGYIGLADAATGHSATTQRMLRNMRAADARVTSTYNQVTDAGNAYHFINTLVQ